MMYFEATDANPLDLVHPSGDLTPFYKFLAKYRRQQVSAAQHHRWRFAGVLNIVCGFAGVL